MPKRKHDKDMEYYLRKIRKIGKKMKRHRRYHGGDSPVSSHSSLPDHENGEPQVIDLELLGDCVEPQPQLLNVTTPVDINQALTVNDPAPELDAESAPAPELDAESAPTDPEVLLALGDLMPEKPKYGPALNGDLARIWNTILKKGLPKGQKLDKNVPENCSLLKAPMLNPEIIATVNDTIINRDKKIETEQNQLGIGLTILGDALSSLINNNNIDRLKLISQLSDAGRILTDLHFNQTKSRKYLIFPVLDKKFLDAVKEVERDDYLYGNNLTDKIKVLQVCQRSGQSIKKPTTSTVTRQGNLNGPPRFNQQRTPLRPGHKKPQSSYQQRKYNNSQYQRQPAVKKPRLPPSQEKTRARQ